MKNYFKRTLSFLLLLAMLLQLVPIQSSAASPEETELVLGDNPEPVESPEVLAEEDILEDTDVSDEHIQATVLGEIEELREQDTKHFRLSDGTNVAVSYGIPVHYKDEDGE